MNVTNTNLYQYQITFTVTNFFEDFKTLPLAIDWINEREKEGKYADVETRENETGNEVFRGYTYLHFTLEVNYEDNAIHIAEQLRKQLDLFEDVDVVDKNDSVRDLPFSSYQS